MKHVVWKQQKAVNSNHCQYSCWARLGTPARHLFIYL